MYSDSAKYLCTDIIRIRSFWKNEYHSYSYSVKILIPNIICIRIWSKFWFRILFVFIFGQNSDSEYYLYSYSVHKTVFAHLCLYYESGFRFCQTCKALLIVDCGAPSGWPQVKSWYINGHDFQIFIDINISLSPFISFKEILIQFKQKKYDQRLNMTEAYCWKGRFCKLFWFFSVLAQIVFFVLYACFVETSLMQLQNQLLPYLLKIFQFTARLKKQLFRHSPTQEGKDMFLIFQFLLAPSGALEAIPTY